MRFIYYVAVQFHQWFGPQSVVTIYVDHKSGPVIRHSVRWLGASANIYLMEQDHKSLKCNDCGMTISLKESEKAGRCLLQLVGICYKETNVFVIPLGCGHILKGTNDHFYRQLFSNMNLVVTLETWMKRSIPWKSFFCSNSVFQRFRKAAHTYRWNLLNTKKTLTLF